MNKTVLTSLLSVAFVCHTMAQDTLWTLNDCMRYAVENSPKTKKQAYTNANYKEDYQGSVASLFPSLGASTGISTSFGRSIDPETNTYSNTSNLSNNYEVSGSLPLFNAGILINNIKVSKVARLKGVEELQQIEDELSINTMQAFANVLYYRGAVTLAKEKLAESNNNLYKSTRLESLGLKGKADVAQVAAQAAADDYNLTHQQNLYDAAMLTLKENMNYPIADVLSVDTLMPTLTPAVPEEPEAIYLNAMQTNPTAKQAEYTLRTSKLNRAIARGKLFPSISMNGGVNTRYFENLNSEMAVPTFNKQFRNNLGEWVGVTVSIPIFNGLSRRTSLNKARNNMRIAEQQQVETLRLLQNEIEKAIQDRNGLAKETVQMDKQVDANTTAYEVTLRKYEKGLLSALDLQISANNLLLSKANRLQAQLNYLLKCKLVDYYKGISLIEK